MIDLDIIRKYIEIQETTYKLFLEAHQPQKPIYDAIGMSRQSFAQKIRNHSFKPDEILKISAEFNKTLQIFEKLKK